MSMTLLKYLQAQGIGSRKQCAGLIEDARVSIDGAVINQAATLIDAHVSRKLMIDETELATLPLPLWHLILHKPLHYETSHKPRAYPSVFSLLPRHWQSTPMQAVGRLDEDTTGILLITNDGQFNHRLTSPKHGYDKIYRVTLKHPATPELCAKLLAGVRLHDDNETVAAHAARLQSEHSLILTIREGKYHQVKRMVAAAGNRVEALHRQSFGPWSADDLAPGQWRLFYPDQEESHASTD